MTRHLLRGGLLLAATALLLPGTVPAASAAPAHKTDNLSRVTGGPSGPGGVTQIPVSFQVRNVNRSKIACHSDGRTYTVRGHLVAPTGERKKHPGKRAVTLYLHGLGFGEFFWRYRNLDGYHYAADQARAGHTSVVIDRLGYDSSDKPPGKDICLGSRADIAHQMVTALREGTYTTGKAGHSRTFDKVTLAGHSVGGLLAEAEAYNFGDIDGLIVISYSDVVVSPLSKKLLKQVARKCKVGGMPVEPGGPGGYALFAPPDKAKEAFFHSTPPQIIRKVKPLLNPDPCGDTASFMAAVKAAKANVGRIHVPVLVVTGAADALIPPPAGPRQAKLYTGSPSVTQVTLPNKAHAVTTEAGHKQLETTISHWLRRHVENPHGAVGAGEGGTQPTGASAPLGYAAGLTGLTLAALFLRRRLTRR